MTALEFLSLGLKPNEHVLVRYKDEPETEAVYGGLRTNNDIYVLDPDDDLRPVLRKPSLYHPEGRNFSFLGKNGPLYVSLRNLVSVRRKDEPEKPEGIPMNPAGEEETIEVVLDPQRFPKAYANKLAEVMEQGAFDTEADAKRWLHNMPIVLELYYEKDQGLFAVESGCLEGRPEDTFSPYTKTPFTEIYD